MSVLIRNSAYLSAGQIVRVALQSALFLGLSRMLGASGYGRLAGIMAIATAITPIATLGAQFWALQEIARARTNARAWVVVALRRSFFAIPATVALAVLLCLVILPENESRLAIWLLVLSEVAWVSLFNICSNALVAVEAARPVSVLAALMPAVRLALLGLLVLSPIAASVERWAVLYFVGSGIVAYTGLRLCLRTLEPAPIERLVVEPPWRDGLLMSTTSASSRACADLDKSLLSAMSSPATSGAYAAAYRIVELLMIPVFSLQNALFPALFRAGKAGGMPLERIARSAVVPVLYTAISGAALYAIAVPLTQIFGPGFDDAADSIRGLCALPALMAIRYFVCNSLAGSSHHKANLLVHLGGLAVNISLNLLLIAPLGVRGAIYASYVTEATIVALALPMRIRLNRQERVGFRTD